MLVPGSICDVLPAVAALLGVPDAVDRLGLAEQAGQVDRVAVVLVDGLGWHLLPELAGDAPLLASVLAGGAGRLSQLVCTFPSTTPTQPGVAGHRCAARRTRHPGLHGQHPRHRPGAHPHRVARRSAAHTEWQPLPTWFERLQWAGIGARAVLPASFIGSGLTDAAYRGAQFLPDAAQRLTMPNELTDELRAAPGAGVRLHRRPGHRRPCVRCRLAAVARGRGRRRRAADPARRGIAEQRGAAGDRGPRRPQHCVGRSYRPRPRPTARRGSAGGRRRTTGALPAHRARRRGRRTGRLDRGGWPAGPRSTAASRRWPPGCSGRSVRRTWRGSATSSSSAPARQRCWQPHTSPSKWLASSAFTAPAPTSRWRSHSSFSPDWDRSHSLLQSPATTVGPS